MMGGSAVIAQTRTGDVFHHRHYDPSDRSRIPTGRFHGERYLVLSCPLRKGQHRGGTVLLRTDRLMDSTIVPSLPLLA